jgi:hypothetical protein
MKSLSMPSRVASLLVVSSISALGCGGAPESSAEQSASALSSGAQPMSKAHATYPDYVLTPNGVFAHKDCVHGIDPGDVVNDIGNIQKRDGTVQVVATCGQPEIAAHASAQKAYPALQPAADNGWTEAAVWNAPGAVGQFESEFHVPAAPSNYDGQLIYIFPGLQGGGAILQTVIQYGNNGSWGGEYWSMNTWAGGGGEYGGNYYFGNAVSVNTGDEIHNNEQGFPNNCNANGCMWEVLGVDGQTGATSQYDTYINISWTQVLGLVIEVYGVDTCADYPATYDNGYNFWITGWSWSGTGPQWTPGPWSYWNFVETCGENITSNDNLVNLYY